MMSKAKKMKKNKQFINGPRKLQKQKKPMEDLALIGLGSEMPLSHTKSVYKRHASSKFLEDFSGVIDFNELQRKDDLEALDQEAEDEIMLEEVVPSREILSNSEDPTRKFQYPLVNTSKPPKGIPFQCRKDLWFQYNWYIKLRSIFLVSESPLLQCGCLQGFLGLHHERFRHLTTSPYIIHPYSDFSAYWNFSVGLITAITVIYSPFMVTFKPLETFNGPVALKAPLLFSSAVLLLDIVLNFCTGVRDKYSHKIILERSQIVRRYLRGWFLYDIVTRMPWDIIIVEHVMNEQDKKDVQKLWTVRLITFATRILRYQKIFSVLCRVSDTFSFKSLVSPWILKVVVLMNHILHWLACFHWLLPHIANVGLKTPKPKSWITVFELWDKSIAIQYLNCFLRSLSNLLTLDGGDFIPREPEEILCTAVGICLSVSMFGYFYSSFVSFFSDRNASQEKYKNMLDLVENYLTFKRIPDHLQQKVLQYFEKKYRGHVFAESALLSTLSATLRTEIACHNCRVLVENVPLFKTLPPSVIVSLVEKLVYEIYVPGDILIAPNTVGNCMYFIQDGEVDVLSPFGKKINTLRDGDFFGEISLITDDKRMKTIVAKVPCEIYKLSREDFKICVEAFPEVYGEILTIAQERIDAERIAMEEAARNAEKIRLWKHDKDVLKKLIEEENKIKVDESGVDIIEDESEGGSYLTGISGEDLESRRTRMDRSLITQKTQRSHEAEAKAGDIVNAEKHDGKLVAGLKDIFKHLKRK